MFTKLNKITTIFFGTHDFAAQILQELITSPLIDIKLVITQPDKPVGRKKELTPPPVKVLANKYNIPVAQPENLKSYSIASEVDLGITAQYGLLIPPHILATPQYGLINIHTSLLPKYRGASPIQSALINAETKTGVTIMLMDEGLDTGPILAQKEVKIAPDDTCPQLEEKLAKIAKICLSEALPDYISGDLTPKSQDNSQATTCKELTRENGHINWSKTNQEIYNLYRGLTPWPGIWTSWQKQRLKLLEIKLANLDLAAGQVSIEDGSMYIGCGAKAIEILKLQLEGKQTTDTKTFINGYKQIHGEILN